MDKLFLYFFALEAVMMKASAEDDNVALFGGLGGGGLFALCCLFLIVCVGITRYCQAACAEDEEEADRLMEEGNRAWGKFGNIKFVN